ADWGGVSRGGGVSAGGVGGGEGRQGGVGVPAVALESGLRGTPDVRRSLPESLSPVERPGRWRALARLASRCEAARGPPSGSHSERAARGPYSRQRRRLLSLQARSG